MWNKNEFESILEARASTGRKEIKDMFDTR